MDVTLLCYKPCLYHLINLTGSPLKRIYTGPAVPRTSGNIICIQLLNNPICRTKSLLLENVSDRINYEAPSETETIYFPSM